jgi:hypothetical protein
MAKTRAKSSGTSGPRGSTVTVTPSGLHFASTPNGKTYLSVYYHQPGVPNFTDKSRWDISRHEEFELFCDADDANWLDGSGYWAVAPGFTAVGTQGERVAKFPQRAASTPDWHGFPFKVTPVSRPDAAILSAWTVAERLTFVQAKRLARGKQ